MNSKKKKKVVEILLSERKKKFEHVYLQEKRQRENDVKRTKKHI